MCPLVRFKLSRRVKETVSEESRITTGLAEASAGTVKVHVRRAERKVGNILIRMVERNFTRSPLGLKTHRAARANPLHRSISPKEGRVGGIVVMYVNVGAR